MKKRKLGFFFLFLAALLILGWFSGNWISQYRAESRYRIPESIATPTSPTTGEAVPVSFDVVVPRFDAVRQVSVAAGQGSVAGRVAVRRKLQWIDAREKISFPWLYLRSGKIPAGEVKITFASGKKATILIPEIEATPAALDEMQQVQLAGDFVEKRQVAWIYAVAVVVLALAGILVAIGLIRRHRKQKAATFYETMLAEIEKVKEQSATPESGVAHLTDLVRRYLDVRFACAIESASTWEFLRRLEQQKSQLPLEIHPFLREFLHYADQVKFARAGSNWAKLAEAADRAADLVRATMPQEKETK